MDRMTREKYDMMDADDQITKDYFSRTNSFGKFSSDSYSESNPSSPTPTSILLELTRSSTKAEKIVSVSYSTSPLLLFLRVQAVGELNPIDVKHLGLHFSHVETFNSTSLDKNSELSEEETEPKREAKSSLGRTNGATNKKAMLEYSKFTTATTAATATSTTIATQDFLKAAPAMVAPLPPLPSTPKRSRIAVTTTTPPPPPPPFNTLKRISAIATTATAINTA
ncbi:LOW QUALITY PROTEIN: hypothetical protein TorRG33x02_273800 [Trema orientale]|uniref:Uncharacterized protein n=1 Tax=Trema orientale TaxID=63057 RepID=A0A2P5CTA5_TREOI|nr:LOW QUALITY PROTEIN: hypothetical protein TorRG33x02_273800 [Trema orientale]